MLEFFNVLFPSIILLDILFYSWVRELPALVTEEFWMLWSGCQGGDQSQGGLNDLAGLFHPECFCGILEGGVKRELILSVWYVSLDL